MQIGSRSEIGHVRRRNEDALLVDEKAGVVAVADGLGGHPAGDLASEVARSSLGESLSAQAVEQAENPAELLDEALQAAHEAVLSEAAQDMSRTGMATTAVVAAVRGGSAWVAHVGDSRAYRLDGSGELTQLTQDHGMGGYITQALGLHGGIDPDIIRVDLPPGTRLLLCTDGLTNMVSGIEIARILASTEDAQQAADELTDAALTAGGIDNVTLVVVDP